MTGSPESPEKPETIEVGPADLVRRIAVRAREGDLPGLFWLGGFKSDMRGTKALALDAWAAERRRACIRFDYSGHGESGGDFVEGTIGRWLEESVAVFEQFCVGPQVVIGSSMGGWMALLLTRELAATLPPLGQPLLAPGNLSGDLGPGEAARAEVVDSLSDRVLGLGHDLPHGAELRDVVRAHPPGHGADHADRGLAEVAGLGTVLCPLPADPAQVGAEPAAARRQRAMAPGA